MLFVDAVDRGEPLFSGTAVDSVLGRSPLVIVPRSSAEVAVEPVLGDAQLIGLVDIDGHMATLHKGGGDTSRLEVVSNHRRRQIRDRGPEPPAVGLDKLVVQWPVEV